MLKQKIQRRLELIAIIGSIIIVGLGTGLTIPLVSLKLIEIGANMGAIGVMAAAPSLGILLAAPLAANLSLHFPIKKLLILAMIVSAISILSLFIFKPAIHTWFILRLAMGFAMGILVVLGETYINQVIEDSIRGRIVAFYTSIYTACQVAGPFLLAWFGSDEIMLVIAMASIHIVALLFLLPGHFDFLIKEQRSDTMSMTNFICYAPVIAIAVLLFAFFDNTVLSLIPLYGMDYHFSERDAVLMISAILAGDACLQIPIGWMADRFDRKNIHIGCGAVTLLFILVLPFLMGYPLLLWPALMLLGGAAGGIYTLALIRVGEYYTGHQLMKANAAITFLFGLGGLIGPLMCSTAILLFGSNGLVVALILITVVFLMASIYTKFNTNDYTNNSSQVQSDSGKEPAKE